MHRRHLIPCLVMLAAAVLISLAWGVQPGTLATFGVVLLCPVMMLLMMGGMAGFRHSQHSDHAPR